MAVSVRKESPVPEEVLRLVTERQTAREARDFAKADLLRDALLDRGWIVKDTPQGPRVQQK